MKKTVYLILAVYLILTAFQAKLSLFSVPANWPAPSYEFSKNPLKKEKIELGRALFYDPILSRDNTISCSSCHLQNTAFAHIDHDLSHGIDNHIGTRNAPALMNLAWGKIFMWDGAINHLDMQALAPMQHPDEMDEKIEHVVSKLQHSSLYPKLFYKAFGDSIITGEHTLKAISQFMLTIVSCNSKYDRVMRHEESFSEQELKGYDLFKKNCASCHKEPLFTNGEFANNGLKTDTTLRDIGRMKITGMADDSLKFKVPTLRNIEFSFPYMHDGRFKKLSEVLNHYTGGIQPSPSLAKVLAKPLPISSNDKVNIIAFLLTLSDSSYLHNPQYAYPKNILSQ